MNFLVAIRGFCIQPAVGHLVSSQKIAQGVGTRRPAVSQHAHAFEDRSISGVPIFQQIVQHRIQVLLGRIPRFQQVMMNTRFVDSLDRRVRVGVGREEHAPCFRFDFDIRVFESLDCLFRQIHCRRFFSCVYQESPATRLRRWRK